MTTEQFVSEIKRLLSSPYGEIAFTELINGKTKKAYGVILQHAHYYFAITLEFFSKYVEIHYGVVEQLMAASPAVVRYDHLKQQKLFADAMYAYV